MKNAVTAASLLLLASGFATQSCESQGELRPIVVLYDNDVHCGIDGYIQMAGLRDAIVASDTAYVAVVSSGDYIQGGTAGTLSKGQSIIDIMNAVGFDAVTIGNHEFDYKTPRLLELTDQLSAPVTCVNFSDIKTHQQFYAPYVLKQYGPRKVGFVGVITPSTLQAEAAAFYDESGNQLYDLHHDEVFDLVQRAVNEVRGKGADYVVVLSHLGEVNSDKVSGGLIANTSGIDVVLDGHTHSVIPCDTVLNKEGKPVLSTQTGTKLQHVGKLLIMPDGTITTELLSTQELSERSEKVAALVDSVQAVNAELTGRICGTNAQLLTINDEKGVRLVRRGETNLANYVADAFRRFGESELAFVNGGGVRVDLPQGDITYGNLMEVMPFETQLCVIRISGHLLVDVLEVASDALPSEAGYFVQPSGFRYTVSAGDVPRVSDVQVLNARGKYEPIDPDRQYTLTTQAYNLTQYQGLMQNCEVVKQNIGLDVEALYNYLQDPLKGVIGNEYAHSQGRITIR